MAQTNTETKNALTAEDKKPQTGPQIVNLTDGDMYKDQSGRDYRPVKDEIAHSRASVVTSTPGTFKKDVESSSAVKVVVVHSQQRVPGGPAMEVVYKAGGGRLVNLTEPGKPIHISGSRVYVVGCGMDQKASSRLFSFDRGAQVRGVNGAGGVGEGVVRALQWERGVDPAWGGLVWR